LGAIKNEMTEYQSNIAENFIRILQKSGGTENIDIISNQLEELGIDIDKDALDFEVVERYLIRQKIIETVPPDNYFYNSLEDLNEIIDLGLKEYVEQRKEMNKPRNYTARNIVVNQGHGSHGDIHDSSSSLNITNSPKPQKDQKTTIARIIAKWFWWIMGIVASIIVWYLTTN
jgi:hypothetical protein